MRQRPLTLPVAGACDRGRTLVSVIRETRQTDGEEPSATQSVSPSLGLRSAHGMMSDILSEQDVTQFRSLGYVVLRGALSPDEVARLRAEVDDALRDAFGSRYRRNTRDEELEDGEVAAEGNFLPLMSCDRSPLSVSLVADDRRFALAAERLIGPSTVVSPALATCLVSDTPWHNDTGIGESWVRFNAYLDVMRTDAGALRIRPGTQHAADEADQDGETTETPIETSPGDVIAFDPRAQHGAFGGSHRLRWSIDFARMPDGNDAAALTKTRELVGELSSWPHPDRWPVWCEWSQSQGSAQRKHAIQQLRTVGVYLDD